ncbi:MAG: hypothetical protein E5Y74_00655 [Mesorhizobium sp.]|nr:MAG: hypothetical protein E5Y74_00655 [Mesorhizobium sp.]
MSAFFVVQSFTRGDRGGLRPDIPVQAQNTNHARRMAERLSQSKALVVAFTREGDASTGEFGEAMLITALGDVPDEVREMPAAAAG